jgi:exodeoxyribonuclease VII large subunit
VLARGFALVRSEAGKPLRSAAAVNAGARVDIEFADGRVRAMAEVRDMTGPPAARPARRRTRRREPDPGQGSLF